MNFAVTQCPGINALSQWEHLRNQWRPGEAYPFLIGDQEQLNHLTESLEYNNREVAAIIAESRQLNISDWLKSREIEQQEAYEMDEEFNEASLLGEWPEKTVNEAGIKIHRDLVTGKVKPLIYIGLAKVEAPWMLPAFLHYGGWNECPDATVHCAIMRYWNQQYGAEIVTMSSDVIECSVKNPPSSKEAAIKLAREPYWYCEDIVMQGTATIANLAAGLQNSQHWFFWWD